MLQIKSKVTPEQERAVKQLYQNIPRWRELLQNQPLSAIMGTGFFSFSASPFPKLPHDNSWIWNQSNGKVSVELESGENQIYHVTLQKMNARKRRGCPKAPSYKAWLYTLAHKASAESVEIPPMLHAVWCEKGSSGNGQEEIPQEIAPVASFMAVNMHLPTASNVINISKYHNVSPHSVVIHNTSPGWVRSPYSPQIQDPSSFKLPIAPRRLFSPQTNQLPGYASFSADFIPDIPLSKRMRQPSFDIHETNPKKIKTEVQLSYDQHSPTEGIPAPPMHSNLPPGPPSPADLPSIKEEDESQAFTQAFSHGYSPN
jgi:hypothetical protein